MENVLAGQGLQLSYARDPSRGEDFDPDRILEDLSAEGTAHAMLSWQSSQRMAASDHLVLATERSSGRCLGMVAASDMATDREPFLLLDAAYVAPVAGTDFLLKRMLAYVMLRIAGQEPVPNIIAACVRMPFYIDALHDFGRRFGGASLLPVAPTDAVIDLRVAALARRIMRVVRPGSRYAAANGTFAAVTPLHTGGGHTETLVVLDLSAANDAAIVEHALQLYRARLPRELRACFLTPLVDTAPAAASSLRDITAV